MGDLGRELVVSGFSRKMMVKQECVSEEVIWVCRSRCWAKVQAFNTDKYWREGDQRVVCYGEVDCGLLIRRCRGFLNVSSFWFRVGDFGILCILFCCLSC